MKRKSKILIFLGLLALGFTLARCGGALLTAGAIAGLATASAAAVVSST